VSRDPKLRDHLCEGRRLSVCKALSRLLRSAGYKVRTYAPAGLFLEGQCSAAPDVLILDLRMPGMNGLDLQSHLAASACSVPIVFIGAHEDDSAKNRALAAGAVAFFHKPFDEKDLLGAVSRALEIDST
jgi:FixJ family two-component response regulator